jgi:nucleoside-diphosphate-sugar epimerase
MKILVTGATGFIGSHFINHAHLAGHEIIALRRSVESYPRVPLDSHPVWLDKSMTEITTEDIVGCDALVHLAAVGITPQPASWKTCYQFNVLDSLDLINKAIDAGIGRFVIIGTYAEYGEAGLRYDKIPPSASLEPTDIYAASKASASMALCSLARVRKVHLSYLRLFSVFGEGQFEGNFWPQLKRAALAGEDFPMTKGDQIRDFIEVGEVADKILKILSQTNGILVKNIASGVPVSLLDFASAWWEIFQAKGRLMPGALESRPGEIARYIPG